MENDKKISLDASKRRTRFQPGSLSVCCGMWRSGNKVVIENLRVKGR